MASFKLDISNWRAGITFFNQEMLKRGFLTSDRCYANYKHDEYSLNKYKNACLDVFEKISKFEREKTLVKKINGPLKMIDFGRFLNQR